MSGDKAPRGASHLDQIKRLAIIAMFSDDKMMDHLVLKGGNALDLIHQISARASLDVDFSMEGDFPEGLDSFRTRIERALHDTFRAEHFEVFDFRMEERPPGITEDVADFWGGYAVEFKVIERKQYDLFSSDIAELRKYAGRRFFVDISRFEYICGSESQDLDGYRIHVYSAEMMVCEKLRAICQQMPEYGPVVKRNRAGAPRARDFLDIQTLIAVRGIDITSSTNVDLLKKMFGAKRVNLSLLGQVGKYREFHRTDFPSVVATAKPGVVLRDFDFYFDYVLDQISRLESLWNV